MKIIRALFVSFAVFVPVAAAASPAVRAPVPGCPCTESCPMHGHCPFC